MSLKRDANQSEELQSSTNLATYGLRIEGLAGARRLLGQAAVDWPVLQIEKRLGIVEVGLQRESLRGIVLGGSGNGEAIVANKVRGIRCGLCWNAETARLNRLHNDGNVLSIGQRMIPEETALEIVRVWLATPFEGGRHLNRIRQIEQPPMA